MMTVVAREQRLGAVGILLTVSSCALIFLLIAFPMVLKLLYVKAFLFFVVLAATALEFLIEGQSRLDLKISWWFIGLAFLSFFFVIEGFFRNTPGASKMALVYVLWPLVYMIWIAGLAQRKFVKAIDVLALIGVLFIDFYGCAYFLTQLKILPETRIVSALSMDWEFESFGTQEGYTGMAFPGVNSLPFLLPYLMARIATKGPEERPTLLKSMALWTAVILGWFVTLVASRRVLFLVVMLTPLFIAILRRFQSEADKRLSRRSIIRFTTIFFVGIIVAFISLGVVYRFDFSSFWQRFSSAFDLSASSTDESGGGTVRREQLFALTRGWLDHPILGAGHGATAAAYGSIRSDYMPWAYELSYNSLLFQIGLLGLVVYAAGVVWIFRQGITVIREGGEIGRMMVCMLVGLVSVLIAHATDPYLDRFDGMWMFFLPLVVINYWLTNRNVAHAKRTHYF